jgi:modulator of FtsH protease
MLLLALLAVGVFLLIPGQPLPALAAELGGTGLLLTLPGTAELVLQPTGKDTPRTRSIVAAVLILLPAAALLAAAATLVFGAGGGLYWVAGAVISGIAAACGNAWVLLVEIQR